MTSAQRLIWETAGKPDVPGSKAKLLKPEPAVCAVTGEHEQITADATRALGENFTDQSLDTAHYPHPPSPPRLAHRYQPCSTTSSSGRQTDSSSAKSTPENNAGTAHANGHHNPSGAHKTHRPPITRSSVCSACL